MENISFRQINAPEMRKAEEGRKITFVASDSSRDTAGTVLNQAGWDLTRFNNNGIIGYQHKVYGGWDDTDNPDNVIGKGHAYIDESTGEKRLMVDVEFEPAEINPLAEKVYQKLLFGSLKAVSVGFMPIGLGEWGKDEESINGANPTYYFKGQELLEVSVVNIPANPNALKKSLAEANAAEMAALREQTVEDTAEERKAEEEAENAVEMAEQEAEQQRNAIEREMDLAIAAAAAMTK